MKWMAEMTTPQSVRCIIERDLLTSLTPGYPDQYGYYLYVWADGKGVRDDLQDTLEQSMHVALKDYGVPLTAWKLIEKHP
jgi:hypothetical protein